MVDWGEINSWLWRKKWLIEEKERVDCGEFKQLILEKETVNCGKRNGGLRRKKRLIEAKKTVGCGERNGWLRRKKELFKIEIHLQWLVITCSYLIEFV